MNDLVPEEWNITELGNVAKVIDPHPSHRAPDEEPFGVPFAGIGDLDEYGNLKESKVRRVSANVYDEHIKRYKISSNTIGFGRVASIGKIVDFKSFNRPITISPTMAIVEPYNIHKKFLVNTLKSINTKNQINLLLTGSTRSSLGIALLRELKLPLPPRPEQQKIAAILTSVDEVIEKTQTQINKLKDLKTGMMQELLTRGVGVDGKPHTEFKDSPVGRIPKGWDVIQISELCSHIVDCVNKTAPIVDIETPYKMIRTTNVRHGRVDTENVRRVSKETYETWTRRLKPENGDLIFTREAPVGECGILEDSRGVFLGQRTMMYRANEAKTSSRFLMYSLMSEYGKQQLEDFSGGSTVPHMRVPDCGKILIKTPPVNEQKKIINALNSVDDSILQKEKKLAKVQNTKKALMQDLLTGKVRVKVDS